MWDVEPPEGSSPLICDADDEVAADWVDGHVRALENAETVVGAPWSSRALNPARVRRWRDVAEQGISTSMGYLPFPQGCNVECDHGPLLRAGGRVVTKSWSAGAWTTPTSRGGSSSRGPPRSRACSRGPLPAANVAPRHRAPDGHVCSSQRGVAGALRRPRDAAVLSPGAGPPRRPVGHQIPVRPDVVELAPGPLAGQGSAALGWTGGIGALPQKRILERASSLSTPA